MVYSGTTAASFTQASQDILHLGDLTISSERVRRACGRVGGDRVNEQQRRQEAFQSKPLPEQSYGKPADVEPPEIACVMCDGGRYQLLDRSVSSPGRRSARKGEHWKESRIGLLVSMSGEQHESDPQPSLPPELRYDAMADKLSEIGKTGAKLDLPEETAAAEETSTTVSDGLVGATLEHRGVVASRQSWEAFGPLLASQAWYRGFAAATRKVFVSDGSATIEKLQQTHFSHYTSVLDILHALSYGLAAARAISADEASAQQQYDSWAAKIWEGRVDEVVDELTVYGRKFGEPPPDVCSDDPREVIRRSRVYYDNHACRMDYPSYRRAGFPLTSSLMESMVKQVSRRVKGTEKYWSSSGGESILRLCGEYLSDNEPMRDYWDQRSHHAPGVRAYRHAGQPVYN
ncbi:hypothetical protein LCGC14_2052940 [marine sediment metagenome]|uniref:Uncharacterized protein n=1 Tax=marine sediment metagenome TaxID=412755 RepID=A0A0F9HKF6_9ZZZZ